VSRAAKIAWGLTLPRNGVSRETLTAIQAHAGARFFVDRESRTSLVAAPAARYPQSVEAIVRSADSKSGHRFSVLGSGPAQPGEIIDWHLDLTSGFGWSFEQLGAIGLCDNGPRMKQFFSWRGQVTAAPADVGRSH
jgi:hypothetical protein